MSRNLYYLYAFVCTELFTVPFIKNIIIMNNHLRSYTVNKNNFDDRCGTHWYVYILAVCIRKLDIYEQTLFILQDYQRRQKQFCNIDAARATPPTP